MAKNMMGIASGSSGVTNNKKTSIGNRNVKTSSMNKSKKRGYKKYRGQGK
jgi:hypothetical protein